MVERTWRIELLGWRGWVVDGDVGDVVGRWDGGKIGQGIKENDEVVEW